MKAVEIRDTNFFRLRGSLDARQAEVLEALTASPFALTTRALAGLMGRDVLAVRPRVTELAQVGLVVCVGRTRGQGLYRAATQAEWEAQREGQASTQMALL